MKIVLYDIPSKGRDVCWSPNTWKARVALNFKGLAYESEFVEMPQIAPKLKELGVAPNESGTPYTLPTVGFGDETIMDSKNIAQKLQEIQPEPPLYLDASFASEVDDIIMKIIFAIAPVLMSLVPRNLLNQESADYIINVHQRYFGMSLDEIEKTRGGERAWEAMEQEFKSLIDLLKREPGPFFLGKTPSWSDFGVASLLEFFSRLDTPTYHRLTSIDSVLIDVHQACRPWMKKDD